MLYLILLFSQPFELSPVNIGYPPNDSNFADVSPVISADGRTVYFTSDRPGGVGGEDIWFSQLSADGRWSTPSNLKEPVNTKTADGVMCLTSDELTMYFASFRPPSQGNADIFVCQKVNGKWQNVENLGTNVNSKYWETQPAISPDGKKLFFVSNRPDGFGGSDIWMATLTAKGWSEPINLGSNINTQHNEIFPYMLWDGVTLFFASNRNGVYELFKAIWQDSGFSKCEKVKFVGMNNENIISFTVPASGDFAYLTMGKNRAKYDIARVLLPEEMKPQKPAVLIEGVVSDKTDGKPIKGAQVIIENLNTGEVYASTVTDTTGYYKFALPAGFLYGVTITADGYLFSSTHLDLANQESYKELQESSKLSPIKKGEKIVLRNIFFDFNKATLRDESILELNRVVEIMKKNPALVVEIAGHTDDIGTEVFNMELSIKRASAVVNYLVEHGVESERLIAKGYGETSPLVPNLDDESRQLNRRVEFKIVEMTE